MAKWQLQLLIQLTTAYLQEEAFFSLRYQNPKTSSLQSHNDKKQIICERTIKTNNEGSISVFTAWFLGYVVALGVGSNLYSLIVQSSISQTYYPAMKLITLPVAHHQNFHQGSFIHFKTF